MTTRVVLGVDLRTVSLPDAIVAMVEAWYDAQGVEDERKDSPTQGISRTDADEAMECLSYLLNIFVKEENKHVKELMQARLIQGQHVRSNAGIALWNACKISCYGILDPKYVQIDADSSAFDESPWQEGKWIRAVSRLAGVTSSKIGYGGRHPGRLLIPKEYFMSFGLKFRSFKGRND